MIFSGAKCFLLNLENSRKLDFETNSFRWYKVWKLNSQGANAVLKTDGPIWVGFRILWLPLIVERLIYKSHHFLRHERIVLGVRPL